MLPYNETDYFLEFVNNLIFTKFNWLSTINLPFMGNQGTIAYRIMIHLSLLLIYV